MGSEGPGHGFGSGAERDIDDLPRNDANYTALTPLWFLERAALAQPDRASLVHGPVRYTWAETYRRCRRLSSALARRSVGHGSTVSEDVKLELQTGARLLGRVADEVFKGARGWATWRPRLGG